MEGFHVLFMEKEGKFCLVKDLLPKHPKTPSRLGSGLNLNLVVVTNGVCVLYRFHRPCEDDTVVRAV